MSKDQQDDDKTESALVLSEGTIVSHYRIISKIGAGGMGEVYLAEDTTLDRKVAIKFLPPRLCQDEDCRKRFTREAKAAAKLDHPNIVQVYEVGEFEGRPFFSMAYIEGKSLRQLIKEGKLTIEQSIDYTKQICDGLHKAHQSGIVHRDIKPANIIIDKDNKARILDFGLATVSGEEKLNKTGSTLGTVGYMSPEQIEGKTVDHRSDLFSVGVVLYEMLTNRRPFEGDTDAAVTRSIADNDPEPIARYKSGTTGELQQIVDKALSKDPSLRYQHADGMLADLKRLDVASTTSKKSRLGLWLAATLVVIIIGIGYLYLSKSSNKKSDDFTWDNSVAVLIFRNMSNDPDEEYFCENMTDEIITRLGTIHNLKVISLQSMLRFRDSSTSLKEIGKQLQVDNILTGTLQLSGDSIRIRTRLIRVKDDAPIWSDKYTKDLKLNSIFAIQDDISQSIANVLKVTLLDTSKTFASNQGTDDIEAYNAYAKGRYFWRKRTKEGFDSAIKQFENAVKLDPNYAAGWSGLADAWMINAGYGYADQYTGYAKADTFSLRAVELDPNLAEAQASRGLVLYYQNKSQQAQQHFLKAIELNPGYPWAHDWYSQLLGSMGDDVGEMRELKTAYKIDPLSIPVLSNFGNLCGRQGDYLKAIEYYKQSLEIEPGLAWTYRMLTRDYLILKDSLKAIETADKMLEVIPDDDKSYINKGELLWKLGRLDEAEREYQKAIKLFPDLWEVYYEYSEFLADGKRDYKRALEISDKAVQLDSLQPLLLTDHSRLLQLGGRTDEAIKVAQRAIELAPNNANTYRNYGWIVGNGQQRYDEAIEYMKKALALNPRDLDTWWNISQMYAKIGKYKEALDAINKRMELGKSNFVNYWYKGEICCSAGMLDSAFEAYSIYQAKEGRLMWFASTTIRMADISTALGKYKRADSLYRIIAMRDDVFGGDGRRDQVGPLVRQGKLNEALRDLQKGIEVDSVEIGMCLPILKKYVDRADIYLDCLNEPNAAIEELKKARNVTEFVEHSKALWTAIIEGVTAEAMAESGDPIKAEKYLVRAMDKVDSSGTNALNEMIVSYARVLCKQGKAKAGLEKIDTLEDNFYNDYYLGLCYLDDKNYSKTIEVLGRAIKSYDGTYFSDFGQTVLAEYYLGQAYEGNGQTDKAISQYEKFLNIWKNADEGIPSVIDAKERLAKLKSS